MNQNEILSTYENTQSIRKTALVCGVSQTTVYKTLVNAGAYTNDLTERIAELAEQGISQKDISEILRVSRTTVNKLSPYTKGSYLQEEKSRNALTIRRWRERHKPQK